MLNQRQEDELFRLSTEPLDGARLTVVVRRAVDRFTHALICEREGESPIDIGRSVDEPTDVPWPPSPPAQQWDRCLLADDRQGLVAVGMAGTSHWSLSVESRGPWFYWDVACRFSVAPDWLGSTYDLPNSSEVSFPDDRSPFVILRRLDRVTHSLANDLLVVLELGDQGNWSGESQDRQVVVVPRSIPMSRPATARWQYRWGLRRRESS